jgi:hypothetical protein
MSNKLNMRLSFFGEGGRRRFCILLCELSRLLEEPSLATTLKAV